MDSNQRESGIDFGGLRSALGEHEYPRTGAEVVAAHGDAELGFASGSLTVREALRTSRDHTFASSDDVIDTLFSMAPIGAIGRPRYTDRGGVTPEEMDRGPRSSL